MQVSAVSMLRKYNAGKVIESKITREFWEGREDAEMWGGKGLEQVDKVKGRRWKP